MPDTSFTEILTQRLRITRMQSAHAVAFAEYRSDPDVARFQSWESFSLDSAETFIQRMQGEHPDTSGSWFQFALENTEDGTLVGDCALGISAHDPRLAEVGFTIAKAYQRNGFGCEALTAILDYAFRTRGKHRITATTDVRNAGSIALLESLGFRREAHHHRNIFFKGAWGDEYVYALLHDEWEAR